MTEIAWLETCCLLYTDATAAFEKSVISKVDYLIHVQQDQSIYVLYRIMRDCCTVIYSNVISLQYISQKEYGRSNRIRIMEV